VPADSTPTASLPAAPRLDSLDALRGLVMVLMALDHTRDFFHFSATHGLDPLDLRTTTPALFLTRWITHYCAPTFMFLAGAGAFLGSTRGKSKRTLSWFLLTRGTWLIVLEWTYVQWCGWTFALNWHLHFAWVLWALGWSMIALAALVHLPVRIVAGFGLVMIVTHNAFDGVKASALGAFGPLWQILHEGGEVALGGGHVIDAGYPLIPWIGVMAAGYGFGTWMLLAPEVRRRRLWCTGAVLVTAFAVLRVSNLYGDAHHWSVQSTALKTGLSMLDCVKYPPSLCYLLMTLGPALLLLAWWDRGVPAWLRPVIVFGRVPMFFYLLHIPLVHGLAVVASQIRWGRADWLFGDDASHPKPPPDAGFGLTGTYLAWLAAVSLLYFACVWFADLKRRRRDAWLSYF
jgi:uncharacterized membrane protein